MTKKQLTDALAEFKGTIRELTQELPNILFNLLPMVVPGTVNEAETVFTPTGNGEDLFDALSEAFYSDREIYFKFQSEELGGTVLARVYSYDDNLFMASFGSNTCTYEHP